MCNPANAGARVASRGPKEFQGAHGERRTPDAEGVDFEAPNAPRIVTPKAWTSTCRRRGLRSAKGAEDRDAEGVEGVLCCISITTVLVQTIKLTNK